MTFAEVHRLELVHGSPDAMRAVEACLRRMHWATRRESFAESASVLRERRDNIQSKGAGRAR